MHLNTQAKLSPPPYDCSLHVWRGGSDHGRSDKRSTPRSASLVVRHIELGHFVNRISPMVSVLPHYSIWHTDLRGDAGPYSFSIVPSTTLGDQASTATTPEHGITWLLSNEFLEPFNSGALH